MRFKDRNDRMRHPYARRIPDDLWEEIYQEEITDHDIYCMTQSSTQFKDWFLKNPQKNKRDLISALVWRARDPDKIISFCEEILKQSEENIYFLFLDLLKNQNIRELFRRQGDKQIFRVYSLLCESNIPTDTIIEYGINPLNFSKNEIFIAAAESSRIDIMYRLCELVGNDKDKIQEMIEADNYRSFRCALRKEDLRMINYILELIDNDKDKIQKLIESSGHEVFWSAVLSDGFHAVDFVIKLMNNDKNKIKEMIRESNYDVFSGAAAFGKLDMMHRLMELLDNDKDEIYKMITANDYMPFKEAAQNGQLHVLNRLIELLGNDKDEIYTMITMNNYEIFYNAAQEGHLHIMDRLVELLDNDKSEIYKMVTANNCQAFQEAVSNEHLHVMNRFVELLDNDKGEIYKMIKANKYNAFELAVCRAQNGNFSVINRLFEFLSDKDKIQEMIAYKNYRILGTVLYDSHAYYNNFALCNCLVQVLGDNDKVQAMVSEGYNNSCHNFAEHARYEEYSGVVNYLISFSSVYDYAALRYKDPSCRAAVNNANERYMRIVSQKKEQFLNASHQINMFDLLKDDNSIDGESAIYGYYVLRYFIMISQSQEFNPYGPMIYQKIEELLDIPSIKNLVIANATSTALPIEYSKTKRNFAKKPNDLLLLADSVGDERLVSQLLKIEAVRLSAESADYYLGEVHFNLAELAREQELSESAQDNVVKKMRK